MAAVILHPSDLVSEAATHAAPAGPLRFIAAALLLFNVPLAVVVSSHPAAQRIPLSSNASRAARAKWIF